MKIVNILTFSIFLLVCLATPDYSKLWLDINMGSTHGDEDYNTRDCPTCEKKVNDYNSFNPGLGLSYELAQYLDVGLGGYYNSFEKVSFYTSGTLKYPVHLSGKWFYEPGIFAGAATGYVGTPKDTNGYVYGGILPYGGISNTIVYDKFRGTLGFVPDFANNNDVPYSVLTLQLGYNF